MLIKTPEPGIAHVTTTCNELQVDSIVKSEGNPDGYRMQWPAGTLEIRCLADGKLPYGYVDISISLSQRGHNRIDFLVWGGITFTDTINPDGTPMRRFYTNGKLFCQVHYEPKTDNT